MVGWPSFVSPHQNWTTQECCTNPHLILSQGLCRVLGTQLVSFTYVKTETRKVFQGLGNSSAAERLLSLHNPLGSILSVAI